jgi:hypothetical protein
MYSDHIATLNPKKECACESRIDGEGRESLGHDVATIYRDKGPKTAWQTTNTAIVPGALYQRITRFCSVVATASELIP